MEYSGLHQDFTARGTHGITRCYLPPGRGDIPTNQSWYSIYRPWKDARLSWSSWLGYISLSVSLQSSAIEQVLDIHIMNILSWEIAEVVSPCLPRGLWSHIVIRVFLLLGAVCPWHPPYLVIPSCPLSRAFPICNLGTRVVAVVPQPSANLSHQ